MSHCSIPVRDEGIVFRNNKEDVKVDCYVDADFAGLYGTEDPMDPTCVKSRTGYIILLADGPLMWVSRLQTTIALSTQHREYVALSTACRELIPIRELMIRLSKDVSDLLGDMPYCMKFTRFEDNAACLALAKLRKITPPNRHIGSKYHWLRSYVLATTMRSWILSRLQPKNKWPTCLRRILPNKSFLPLASSYVVGNFV
jgi:hypothetical protein